MTDLKRASIFSYLLQISFIRPFLYHPGLIYLVEMSLVNNLSSKTLFELSVILIGFMF